MTGAERIEQLMTRMLVPLKRWAAMDSPKVRRAEVQEVVRLGEQVRQESVALQGDPVRGTITDAMRREVLRRAGGVCRRCSMPLGDDYEIDHIIPVARFGVTAIDNLQAIHRACNRQKAAS